MSRPPLGKLSLSNTSILIIAWMALCFLSCPPQATAASSTTGGRIGVLAPRGPARCLKKWQATADYLTRTVPEINFTIIPLAFEQVDRIVADHRIDFILTNPMQYVDLELRHHVTRIATMRNKLMGKGYTRFGGVLFTRADSPLNTLEDLRGKTLAAVNEESLGGWLTEQREIHDQLGGTGALDKIVFYGTHDRVVEAILEGKADAGSVRTDTLERMQEEGKVDLDLIKTLKTKAETLQDDSFPFRLSTRLYPEWPMAKLPGTPDDTARRVAAALFKMEPNSPAAQDARIAGWTVPLNYQPVHDLLKELKAGPYKDYGKVSLSEAVSQHRWGVGGVLLFFLAAIAFGAYNSRLNRQLKQSRALAEHELEIRIQEETRRRDVESMVRHELRTPLISILSGINYFNDNENLHEDQNRVLAMMRTWADKMYKVIVLNQALISMEQGLFVPVCEPVDLKRILNEALLESGEAADSKDVSIDIRFSSDAPATDGRCLVGDRLLIDIMLSNLIRNAVEASPMHATVTVDVRIDESAVLLIRNKGAVPEDIRETFFDKYVTKGKRSGTGLGTYTARLIARSHGGDITMSIIGPDETELRVEIPLERGTCIAPEPVEKA